MKLLMISGDRSLAQGKKGAFYNTLEELHKYWDRVDIICPPIFNFQFSIFKKTTNHKPQTTNLFGNVFIHPSPWPLILQPFWILKKGLEILKTNNYKLETRNYLMTVHEYPPFYNGIGAKFLWWKIRIPYVIETHHIPGYPRAANFKELFYKLLMRWFFKYDVAKARAVRVVNQRQVPEFLIKSGIPSEKIIYIPSFYIDLDVFKPMPEIEKKYDLVFAARFEKNKGLNLLLDAISSVKIQMPNIKLLIIGSGPEKRNLESRIKDLGLGNNVIFSGWLETADDVARAFNGATIFINPSFNEGGPRVVLEAMACSLPVITTRVGLMLDIIKNGENGFFADWNSHSMADKITHVLQSDNLQKKFSSAGLEIARKFERQRIIKNYSDEIYKLIVTQ